MTARRTLQDALRDMGFPGQDLKTAPCCGAVQPSFSIIELDEEEADDFALAYACSMCLLDRERRLAVIAAQAAKAAAGPDWEPVRGMRDVLLLRCDWTQVSDAPLTDTQVLEWRAYRQALRDVTEAYADPALVVWPEAPASPSPDVENPE